MLHQHHMTEERSGLLNSPSPSDDHTSFSILALKSIIRMVIQIAYEFNSNIQNFDVRTFPPCPPFSMCQAGLLHIKFRREEMDEDTRQEWQRDLDALRECLWWQSHRWRIGRT